MSSMIKIEHIDAELKAPEKPIKMGDSGHDVERIQEWLLLWHFINFKYRIVIDGDFGPQTHETVKWFQRARNLQVDGIVGPKTWLELTMPMLNAFKTPPIVDLSPRSTILNCAYQHVSSKAREVGQNEGPWVRAYMGGRDGKQWAWCVGSALTIIDHGLSIHDMKFTDYLPNTMSCDVLGNFAIKENRLIRNADLKKMSEQDIVSQIKPGDLINLSKTPTDWTHTAIITKVCDGYFETWEGNTNDEGSREGYEVCYRIRNWSRQNIDVIKLGID